MTHTNLSYSPELAETLRIGLINQIIDRQRVIAWADELIEQEDEPAYFLIELSLCGNNHINDMISLLDNYVGEDKPQVSGRVVLGYLYHEYYARRVSLQRVVSTFYWLNLHSTLSAEEQRFVYGLDVDLELAIDGVCGNVADVEQNILRFLTLYQDFKLDNWRQWENINRLTPDKLRIFYQQKG